MKKIISIHNVQLEQAPANLSKRALALMMDLCVMGALVFFIFVLVASWLRFLTTDEILPILGLNVWLFPLYCQLFFRGQTFGQMVAHIRIVKSDGTAPTVMTFVVRFLVSNIELMLLPGLAFMVVYSNKKYQRLADLAANTMVVDVPKSDKLTEEKSFFDVAQTDWIPRYPQAQKLTQPQIALIIEALKIAQGNKKMEALEILRTKVESIVGKDLYPHRPPFYYLKDVLYDYYHLE